MKRSGIVNAYDDSNFAVTVRATGRKKLFMAGLQTEVCVIYPALSAKEEGYEIQVVADASGSGRKMGDDIALVRMQQSGVAVKSTIQVLSELV